MTHVFVSSKAACLHYNVADSTLRRWARNGEIESFQTKGGHYRYKIESNKPIPQKINQKIIYCRVSSKKQEVNLKNQIKYLKGKYPKYKVVSDVGSGINYKRAGFKWILQQVFKGNIKEVVVASKDRFSRFGFDLFEWIFSEFGAVLKSASQYEEDEDFVGDIMEIFTGLTARYHRRRRYNGRGTISETEDTEDSYSAE
jgi:putative resolvase